MNKFADKLEGDSVLVSRRNLLVNSSTVGLSAATVMLLGGCNTMAASNSVSDSDPAADVNILNVALTLEHEAINAYQLGAESGLLEKSVLDVAVLFQSHHKEHRDTLASTIKTLGGSPIDPLAMDEYATALGAAGLKSQADVLKLATRLEIGATNAYLSVIPAFSDSGLAQVAGRLAADETMHWTTLTSVLGMNLPKTALSFGAVA